MTAVMLGTGGWMPTGSRSTNATLATCGNNRLLLDAGTGVERILRQPDLLGDSPELNIVLSHFHLDHVIGITYLPAIADRVKIVVWAPGSILSDISSRCILENLIRAPYLSVPLASFVAEVRELALGTNDIAGTRLRTRLQSKHEGKSVGLRVEDELTLSTDTAIDFGTASFASGCKFLLHEAWTVDSAHTGHSSAVDAATVAAHSDVEELVLTHIHPCQDDPAALQAAACPIFSNTTVGFDGRWIV